MKEILFRGKCPMFSGWVYGSLLITDDNHNDPFRKKPIKQTYQISQYDPGDWNLGGWSLYDVIPETVGQFIGVKGYDGEYENRHKNEVKLFEGDIVEAMSEGSKGTFVVKFRNESQPTFMLFPAWQGGKMWSIAASDVGRTKGDYYDDLRRIGNIHENPELLNP